MSEDIDI
jgi:thioredoxin-like negative regulator of GroEL